LAVSNRTCAGSRRNISTLRGGDGPAYLRFDYSGHGARRPFRSGNIGAWLEESLAAIRALTEGPQILVGCDGGWLALLAARALHESFETERLKALFDRPPRLHEALIFAKMSHARAGAASERDVAARFGLLARAYRLQRR